MNENPTIEEILTQAELSKVTDLRCDLLKSVTSMERKYYEEEINKIIRHAQERYFKRESDVDAIR